ncbi:hypothetical protein ASE75_11455 [Sphingomonas sp. Leaf17]|uniref:hypothetical protein n=1 Tax=Sphingomonas sp. Leaf17 TaxID=1735683 RepID=UPI0007006723|nr:hypothetical protein [Sphingomonas sp. Leaf17]KQM63706.1 hypothetical protein ASE75_11455 [Sphingomonas sp. Leaf17]
MKIDLPTTLADAWALFRAERDLVIRIAGTFLFLPALALALLVPAYPLPVMTGTDRTAQAEAWSAAFSAWANDYGLATVVAYGVLIVGALALFALYLDPERPTVGRAILRGLSLAPRYLLVLLLIGLPSQLGLALFLLPGLYILGRVALAGPILVADRPIGAWRAIVASIQRTRGSGFGLMGLMGFGYLGGQLAQLLTRLAQEPSVATNPVVFTLLCSLAAAVASAAQVMLTMIGIAAYRRVSAR